MSEDAVLYASADGVGEITLNRPGNRNSMTEDVLEGLQAAIEKLRADGDLRCVIITGRGRSFCAGADFKSGAQRGGEGLAPHERSMAMYEPFLGVLEIEVPVIAAMQGHAVGGGLGLAIVCDLRVANESARYGANFTRLGLHPGMATTYILPRLVGLPRAAEWLFTGRLMSGAEAAEAGLANYACSGPDAVLEKARELARDRVGGTAGGALDEKVSLPRHRLGSAQRRGVRGPRPVANPRNLGREGGHRSAP